MTDDAQTNDQNGVRAKLTGSVTTARDAVGSVASTATGQVQAATRRAADVVETNPLAIVAGGIAAGVLAGLLLPRTERETELLQPLGSRLSAGVTSALQAARETGQTELNNMGINTDSARNAGRKLFDSAVKAATSAGQAAVKAGQESVKGQ